MDFHLSPDQQELVDATTAFAREHLNGRAADNDRTGTFDREAWQRCAGFGVLGWPVPTEHGGAGLDPLSCVLAFEALGYGCRDNGLIFAINNHVWACTSYLLAHGTADQLRRWLPDLAAGTLVGAHALTEPEAGSDVLSLTTSARRDGDHYLLNGVKTFISNAPVADLFVAFARTGGDHTPGGPQRQLSAFVVPARAPGVRLTRTWEKAGLRAPPMGELTLTDAVVPAADRLGEEGDGYRIFTSVVELERGFMFASCVGALRRILETAVAHASSRRQFGRPVGGFQAVAHKLADMRVRVELAQLILHRYGWLKANRRVALLESSILKLFVSESLVASSLDAMQLHGARGYVSDFEVEREVRDALATTIYAGTSEIHRSIIARLTGVPDGH